MLAALHDVTEVQVLGHYRQCLDSELASAIGAESPPHREKGIQFLVGVEDAVLSEIIGSRAHALPPRLLVDRLDAVIRQPCRVVRSVRSHCHPQ